MGSPRIVVRLMLKNISPPENVLEQYKLLSYFKFSLRNRLMKCIIFKTVLMKLF